MTPAEIANARKLCEAATAGPWSAELDMFRDNIISACVSDASIEVLAILDTDYEVKANKEGAWTTQDSLNRDGLWRQARDSQELRDAQFIAASRTLLPQLLDEVERLRSALTDFADQDCAYGDDCPTFGTRHGRCIGCKARRALKGPDPDAK